MSGHTPGPWDAECDNGRHPRIHSASARCLVAEIGNAENARWEQWRADARLIAAAPDMLEALKALQAFYETSGDFPNRAFALMDAAIANAEGRS